MYGINFYPQKNRNLNIYINFLYYIQLFIQSIIVSPGDESKYPLSYAFDSKTSTSWISSVASDGTSTSYITANFGELIQLDALLLDFYYSEDWWNGGIDTYYGFPRRIKVSTSLNEVDYTVNAMFTGSTEQLLERAQLTLPTTANCTSVKLEFLDVTENSKVSNLRKAAVAGLTFLRKFQYEYLEYHTNSGFDETHKISSSKIISSSSGDQEGHQYSYAFDGSKETSWISNRANDDTFLGSILANFTEPILLEGFLMSSYCQKKTSILGDVSYSYTGYGFPTKLNVYTASDGEELELSAVFIGTAGTEQYYQFEFKNPIPCTQIKLEFVEVKTNRNLQNNQPYAAVSEITFLAQTFEYPGNGDIDEDQTTIYVSKQYTPRNISDVQFVNFTLPNDNDYLFVVEKKFEFNNIEFEPKDTVSAIKTNCSNKVTIQKCLFNSCSVRSDNGNGGAILSINCGINCQLSKFYNCSSKTGGGGGGLFIVLNEGIEDNVIIEKCNFTSCTSIFGAAIYAFSQIETNLITITNCDFISNTLLDQNENTLYGGSAIYLQAMRVATKRCRFKLNSGDSAIKLDNDFENVAIPRIKEWFSISPVIIEECSFEIDESADSSLYYLR